MSIKELERPIKNDFLCDWAFSQFIELKVINPEFTEREIALIIFSQEYLRDGIPNQLRELARKNIFSVDCIPDVILAILNMEAKGGRSVEELDTLFISAMIYSFKTYFSKVDKDAQLHKIGIIFGLINRMVELKIQDSKQRIDIIYDIFSKLIGWGIYKTFKTNEEALDYIDRILKEL